jgi:hypothetical protein
MEAGGETASLRQASPGGFLPPLAYDTDPILLLWQALSQQQICLIEDKNSSFANPFLTQTISLPLNPGNSRRRLPNQIPRRDGGKSLLVFASTVILHF